jgi:hypothetical protein
VASLDPPVAIHTRLVSEESVRLDRIHWQDERHFHWVGSGDEQVTIGDSCWRRQRRIWRPGKPSQWVIRWARQVLEVASRAAVPGPSESFQWRDQTVLPVGRVKDLPTAYSDVVKDWDAYVLVAKDSIFAVILAPVAVQDQAAGPHILQVLLEPIQGPILLPSHVEPSPWRVLKRPELGLTPAPLPWMDELKQAQFSLSH